MVQEEQKAGENQGCRERQACGIRREQEMQSSMQTKSRKIKGELRGIESLLFLIFCLEMPMKVSDKASQISQKPPGTP